MTDWQPIETAPKDGTYFLAYEPSGDMYRAAYNRDGAFSAFCGRSVVYSPEPTHWIPLCAPAPRTSATIPFHQNRRNEDV